MSTSLKKETNKPLLIGLTGGIGSGKSTVAKIFVALGIPVFDSDRAAKDILNKDTKTIHEINKCFGNMYKSGSLNSEKLARIVFEDESALNRLNNIVHPKVKASFRIWIEENRNEPILLNEAALHVETGSYKNFHKMILVKAPKPVRVDRVIKRDRVEEREVLKRINAQSSDYIKEKHCDFLIWNDGEQLIIPQVLKIREYLRELV